MDIHCKVAAALSIALSLFELFVISLMAMFLGSLIALLGTHNELMRFIAAFGGAILAGFALVAGVNLVAAVCFLRGSQVARIWLILVNGLMLLKFPIGTLIGGYTLWALLRPLPARLATAQPV